MDWGKWAKRTLWVLVPCIVAGLFLPIYIHSLVSPRCGPNQSGAAAQGLRNAVKQFHLQYGSFAPLSSAPPERDFTITTDSRVIAIVLGLNEVSNPRKIAFGEWREAGKSKTNGIIYSDGGASGMLVDQWGNPFRIVLDHDDDNRLANPDKGSEPETLRQTILVYSAIPDGNFESWEDNVTTW